MLSYCAWTHFSPRCQFASGFTYFISGNVTIFLLLFLNFYSKSYKNKKAKVIDDENEKAQNGSTNGICKPLNGFASEKYENGENGMHRKNCNNISDLEEVNKAYEVNKACGDYMKDGKVFLTRRTAKAAYGPEYDFDSIIKK